MKGDVERLDLFGPFSDGLGRAAAELARIGLRVPDVCSDFVYAVDAELGCRAMSVIVYGSYAKGDFDASSDIDFLVVTERLSGLIQGQAGGKLLDGHVETLARILSDEPSEWRHLIGGVDIANRDGTALSYLASISPAIVQESLSPADVAWFEKSIARIRFAKQDGSPALLPLIACAITEYQKSYAKAKGLPEGSPTAWSRMVRDHDPQTARILMEITDAIDDSMVEAIADCIEVLISPAR